MRAQGELRPLYPHSAAYAREHGELDSTGRLEANIACKEAIEASIPEHYRDNRLDTEAVAKGDGEVRDGRVTVHSGKHRPAQEMMGVSPGQQSLGKDHSHAGGQSALPATAPIWLWMVNPGLIDLLTRQARKTMQEQQNSSVPREKLKQEPPAHKPAAPKKQEPER